MIVFLAGCKHFDRFSTTIKYGAMYLDPRTSRWLSTDPALGEYVPSAPVNDEARKRNGNLPGMGGVFNTVNLHLYHYAGNNPIRYTDPDGKWVFQLGLSGSASTGLGIQGSLGVAIGYSKEKGFSFGVYASGDRIDLDSFRGGGANLSAP